MCELFTVASHLKFYSCFANIFVVVVVVKWLKWTFFFSPSVLQKSAVIVNMSNDQNCTLNSDVEKKKAVFRFYLCSRTLDVFCAFMSIDDSLMNVHIAATGCRRFTYRSALTCRSEMPARFYCLIWRCDNFITRCHSERTWMHPPLPPSCLQIKSYKKIFVFWL